MWLLLIVCILVFLFYITHTYFKYWEKKDVPGPRPLPLLGNIGSSIIGLRNVGEVYADIYRKYEDCPFVGVYRMSEPCLMIRDPELIKNVLIKDFNHFMENEIYADKDVDPLVARNTFALKGEEWKKTRQFVTPNFAGLKMSPALSALETNVLFILEGLTENKIVWH